jgi:predicted DNA-binding transcriptional regulator YafY
MTNRNQKSRFTVGDSLPRVVCTPEEASALLHVLRNNYQLLTPEERNHVKAFISGFDPGDTRRHTTLNMSRSEKVEH